MEKKSADLPGEIKRNVDMWLGVFKREYGGNILSIDRKSHRGLKTQTEISIVEDFSLQSGGRMDIG